MNWQAQPVGIAFAGQILAILNESIANDTALYEYKSRTLEDVNRWFNERQRQGFPIVGVIDNKKLLGFGSYGPFRYKPGYKYTVEHSLYVHKDAKGQGIGNTILSALINLAEQNDMHTMIGGVDGDNKASVALHEKHGFKLCGVVKQAGFKFGRYLDLALYQLILDGPDNPVDG